MAHPPTQTLSTIVDGSEHLTFSDIPEPHQHQLAIMSTTIVGSCQNGRGTSSTQTNGGDLRQSPPRVLSLVKVLQGDAEFDQIQVQDWDEKAEEDEVTMEEEELVRVQQEIERLRQEQESIMRRHAIAQCTEAHRQHINREWVRLIELQYTIDILRQQERMQEPSRGQRQHQLNANPPPPPPPHNYIPPLWPWW
jgi:hypothetical protein